MTDLEHKAVSLVLSDRKAFSKVLKVGDRIMLMGQTQVALTPEMVQRVCLHNNFRADVAVGRMLRTEGPLEPQEADDFTIPAFYSADIRLKCSDCGQLFEWQGLPHGFSPYQPTVSIDGQELRISAMPVGMAVPPGLPGFRVTHQSFERPAKEAVKQ